jgi:hypothetical protein
MFNRLVQIFTGVGRGASFRAKSNAISASTRIQKNLRAISRKQRGEKWWGRGRGQEAFLQAKWAIAAFKRNVGKLSTSGNFKNDLKILK